MDSFKSWTKNEKLKSWVKDTVASIENCVERMNDKRLSDKDRDSFGVMLVQLSQAIKQDAEYPNNLAMHDMSDRLLDAFDALINEDVAALEAKYEILRQISFFGEVLISEKDWAAFEAREDGRTYIDFIPTSLTNEQSNQMIENIQSIGAKFDPEVGQWYVEADWKMTELSQGEQENESERQLERLNGEDMMDKLFYEDKFLGEVTSYRNITIDEALEHANVDIKEVTPHQFDWEKVRIERDDRIYSWEFLNVDFAEMTASYSITATEDGKIIGEEIYDADLVQVNKLKDETYQIFAAYANNGRYNPISEMLTPAIEDVINEKAKQLEISSERENEHSKTGSFSVLIQNRTEFEKGGHTPMGVELSLPATKEELHGAMNKLNITSDNPQDFLINGYSSINANIDIPFEWVHGGDFDKLNVLAARIERMSPEQVDKLAATLKSDSRPKDLDELLNMSYEHENAQFKAIYYDNSNRKEVFADTKENVLQAVQEAKSDRKETDRCYIQEHKESGAYKQEGIYLIESGRDVTPVELKRPYISQETFSEIKQEFKEMGAKFDGNKKIFYAERSLGEEAIKQLQDFLDRHDEGI